MPLQRCRVFPRYTEVTQGEYKALGTLRYAIKAFVAEIQIAFFYCNSGQYTSGERIFW